MKYKLHIKKILKKPYYVVFLFVILVLIFCLTPDNDNGIDDKHQSNEDVYKLEKRLESILCNIDGAGRVDVMITLESEGEKIILKDNKNSDSSTLFDNNNNPSSEEKTVMTKDGSKEEPFIRKQTKAEIRGVIVCADGAYDEIVKNQLISSCVAVLDIPVTRVSVVKRKE